MRSLSSREWDFCGMCKQARHSLSIERAQSYGKALKVDLEDSETAAEAKSIERAFQAQPAPAWPC
jgi:hypothetical protein